MSLKQAIKTVLLQQPGLSSTEIARLLGKDRNNVRKAAFEMEAAGELRSENEGGVFRFYVAGSSARPPEFPRSIENSPQVIEAQFRELPAPSSDSGRSFPLNKPTIAGWRARFDSTPSPRRAPGEHHNSD